MAFEFVKPVLRISVLIGALMSPAAPAAAAVEIQWWHAMPGELGREVEQARCRFQRDAERLPRRAGVQGPLYRDADGGAFRIPHTAASGDRSAGRDRDATMMAARGAVYPVRELMRDASVPFDASAFIPGNRRLLR